MKERLARLQLPIIYSGPYSYAAAPIESVFAALKFGDMNPDRLPTGKKLVFSSISKYLTLYFTLRSLTHLADMVASKLAEIPRSVAVRYWHHAILALYGYLYYERL